MTITAFIEQTVEIETRPGGSLLWGTYLYLYNDETPTYVYVYTQFRRTSFPVPIDTHNGTFISIFKNHVYYLGCVRPRRGKWSK